MSPAIGEMREPAWQRRASKTRFLAGVWLTWTAIAIVSYARHHFEDTHLFDWPQGSWPEILSWFACFYPWALMTPAIFRLEARFPLTKTDLRRYDWKKNLAIVFLASLVFSFLGQKIGSALNFAINYAFGKPVSFSTSIGGFTQVLFYFEEFFFWSTFTAGYALRRFAQFHRQARQATQLALEKSQLEASLRQAELENLRMRLNPHFLFNSLQSISVLAQQNPRLASQMLARLGDLLRAALRRNLSAETTVSEEIALTQDYLAIEKMRFGERLAVLVEMTPDSDCALIPTFLLQPLAENAVIHGLRGVPHVGTVTLRAMKEGDRLVLTVADDGLGLPGDGLDEKCKVGIGLSSTRERLQRMYPGEHELLIRNLNCGGTEVRIAIPFRASVRLDQERPGEDGAKEGRLRESWPEPRKSQESTPSEQPARADR